MNDVTKASKCPDESISSERGSGVHVCSEAVKRSSLSYSVFKVGQVGVPTEAHHVDVHDAELGVEVVEVDGLRERPHTQIGLWGGHKTRCLREQTHNKGPGGSW